MRFPTAGRTVVAVLVALGLLGAAVASVAGGIPRSSDTPAAPQAAPLAEPAGPPVAAAADALPTPPATTERMSVGDGEQQGNTQSGGVTDVIAAANGDQAISPDGRWVAFVSSASNLTPGATQPPGRIYLRDRLNGTTTALPWFGREPWPTTVTAAEPTISADGGVVAFTAIVQGTVGGIAGPAGPTPYVVVWDRTTNETTLVSMDERGAAVPGFQPAVSGDGRNVAYTRWAPPAATPPPDTTGPLLFNLTITGAGYPCYGNQYCIVPHPTCAENQNIATISVTATDPSGVASVSLWYRYGFSGSYSSAAVSRSGDTFSGQVSWGPHGDVIVDYYWEAFDSVGNRSVLGYTGDRTLRNTGCIL